LLIVGDINIHLDVKSDSLTIKFDDLLAAHGLIQHVQSPTHRCGHLLDVVITRSDMSITALCVDPPSLSDHSMIVGEIGFATLNGVDEVECSHRRRWRQFDVDSFTADLERSVSTILQCPSADVNELFTGYDRMMRSLLDRHAPPTVFHARRKHSAPWLTPIVVPLKPSCVDARNSIDVCVHQNLWHHGDSSQVRCVHYFS